LRQAHVRRAFLPFAQGALTFLLAQESSAGEGGDWARAGPAMRSRSAARASVDLAAADGGAAGREK
jgi:hypothetical protein